MQRLALLAAACVLLLSSVGALAEDPRRFETLDTETVDTSGGGVPYAVHLPTGFESGRAYPVLIGPGDGEPGSDYSFFWRSGGDPASYGWILVETPVMFGTDAAIDGARLLDRLSRDYEVEGFHLMGFSANSGPVYELALALGERLTSVTGIPGHPRTRDPEQLKALAKVRVHFIVGEKDGYWLRESERANEQLKGLGITTVLDVVEDGEHVLTELVGDGFMERMERMR